MKVKYTLAEIENSFRKVAKVSGFSWGLAEEAGKAARWLAAFNLPGPELMLKHLQEIDGQNYESIKPHCNPGSEGDGSWHAEGGLLCPVITGAAVADRSADMLTGTTIKLGPVAFPILLAATIGQAARYHKTVFTTRWAGVELSCYENGIRIEGNLDDLMLASAESASCQQTQNTTPQQLPSTMAYVIDADVWKIIDELAFKTYAPATEQSRAGAGAGLTDND